MAYVAPIHPATSIRLAVRSRILSPTVESLVIAKSNKLEIWNVDPAGMERVSHITLHGAISMLRSLTPDSPNSNSVKLPDMLFVATERFQYFTCVWDADKNSLQLLDPFDDVDEPYMRQSQSQNRCVVDPVARLMALHLWEGVMTMFHFRVPRDKTKLVPLGSVRISELFVKDSAFVPTETKIPELALLCQTRQDPEDARLIIYKATRDEKHTMNTDFEKRDEKLVLDIRDPYAKILIPVPVVDEPEGAKRYHSRRVQEQPIRLGGLLIVGMSLLMYVDGQNHRTLEQPLQVPMLFATWAQYDDRRFILGDELGGLWVLELACDDDTQVNITSIGITPICIFPDSHALEAHTRTSRASALVVLPNNMLFVASHSGDSKLLHLHDDLRYSRVVRSLDNNAPVLDFVIMDMGNREGSPQNGNSFASGQTRLVAGCGAWEDGSFRSIRSGVGMHDLAILAADMEGVTGLFPLCSYQPGSLPPPAVDTLLISWHTETRVYRFGADGGVDEAEKFAGVDTDSQTLLAGNVDAPSILYHVGARLVTLINATNGETVARWEPPEGRSISTASCNGKWLLLSVSGVLLVALDLHNALAATVQPSNNDQIACVHAARARPDIGVVGFWKTGTVSVVQLPSLEAIHGSEIKRKGEEGSGSVPRDMALVQLHPPLIGGPTLLVALENGEVMNFDVNPNDMSLSSRKTVILGTRAARLHPMPRPAHDGTYGVFATTEHASLIYSNEGRIIYSGTSAGDIVHAAPFDHPAFPGAMVVSSDAGVRLVRTDNERNTHVQTHPAGGVLRRIAYAPNLKVFGIGFIRREIRDRVETITSSFEMMDEVVYRRVGKALMLNTASQCETVEAVISAELAGWDGELADRFVVGTTYSSDWGAVEKQRDRGRILVIAVDAGRNPYVVAEHKVKSHCRSLATMDGYIVAALEKSLIVYRYEEESALTGRLVKLASYIPSSFPLELRISGPYIGVMDLLQSLIVVEFVPPKGDQPAKLIERARHLEGINGTALCSLDNNGETWLQADVNGNLLMLSRPNDASAKPVPARISRMEIMAEINLSEQVNRIRNLNVEHNDKAIVNPEAVLATVEGSIYLFGRITPKWWDLLFTLQTRLSQRAAAAVATTSAFAAERMTFDEWRAYRDENRAAEAPLRFVDGEYVEQFLELSPEMQADVVDGLGFSAEAVRDVIVELRQLH